MYRISLLASFLGVMVIAGISSPLQVHSGGTAQQATPTITFPVMPDPARCAVEPRSVESLAALLGTPTASPVSEAHLPEPSVVEVPIGRPASANVEASIIATVYEFQACFNAGDPRRAFALTTDSFLRSYGGHGPLTRQDIAFLTSASTPTPMDVRPELLAVTDVSVLPDGRAGAFVVTGAPFTGPDTGYMIFAHQGGRWLVDEAIGFLNP